MDVIWEAELDGKYKVKVVRLGDYLGRISISCGEMLMKETEVPLSFGAIFGPDFADVEAWQNWAVDVVDNMKVDNV